MVSSPWDLKSLLQQFSRLCALSVDKAEIREAKLQLLAVGSHCISEGLHSTKSPFCFVLLSPCSQQTLQMLVWSLGYAFYPALILFLSASCNAFKKPQAESVKAFTLMATYLLLCKWTNSISATLKSQRLHWPIWAQPKVITANVIFGLCDGSHAIIFPS